jgi:glycosyltransferase involved in cell wall biosynthesis
MDNSALNNRSKSMSDISSLSVPTVETLPPPPPGKEGWPWTVGSSALPERPAGGGEWPRISIVTPSYNQGHFIEETIRSILLQRYPNLEYIVIDGGSTDGTLEIIKKYEPWISHWVSERDKGQSDAINKGFRIAHGEIIAWLNSDDTYHPDALGTVAEAFINDSSSAMIYGGCDIIDEYGARNTQYPSRDFDLKILITAWNFIPQPATFFRRDAYESVGEVDVSLHYSMDRDLWIRIGRQFRTKRIEPVLANIRYYDDCKTAAISREGRRERLAICRKYGGTIFSRVYRPYLLDEIRMLVRGTR